MKSIVGDYAKKLIAAIDTAFSADYIDSRMRVWGQLPTFYHPNVFGS
jgi:hypothetical protein